MPKRSWVLPAATALVAITLLILLSDEQSATTPESSAEQYVVALTNICACASPGEPIQVRLSGDAAIAGEMILALGGNIKLVSSRSEVPEDEAMFFVVHPARPTLDQMWIVMVETNRIAEGFTDYRADDVVLMLTNNGWMVVRDPSAVGVTVTSSVG